MKTPFPGYFTGSMAFFDAWGNTMCRAENLYFLYQFYNGMFGARMINAEVLRPGTIKSFSITINQLGWSRSGSIGPDPECDIKVDVVPLYPGGNFWIKNFMFAVSPDPPQEVVDFVEEMGKIPIDGRGTR